MARPSCRAVPVLVVAAFLLMPAGVSRAGSSWSAPTELASAQGRSIAGQLLLATSERGHVAAVWGDPEPPSGTIEPTWVRTRSPGGGWTARRQVGDVFGAKAVTAMDARGRVITAWTRHDGTRPPESRGDTGCCVRVLAAIRGLDGEVRRSGFLSPPGWNAHSIVVRGGPDGRSVVMWQRGDRIDAAVGERGRLPSSFRAIARAEVGHRSAHAHFSADGSLTFTWVLARAGVGMRVLARVRSARGGLGPARVVLQRPLEPFLDEHGLDAGRDGEAVLAWTARWDRPGRSTRFEVWVAERAPGRGFRSARRLAATESSRLVSPAVDVAPDGSAVVTWMSDRDLNRVDDNGFFIAARRPGGRWGAVRRADRGDERFDAMTAAVADGGRVALAFHREEITPWSPWGRAFLAAGDVGGGLSAPQPVHSPESGTGGVCRVAAAGRRLVALCRAAGRPPGSDPREYRDRVLVSALR